MTRTRQQSAGRRPYKVIIADSLRKGKLKTTIPLHFLPDSAKTLRYSSGLELCRIEEDDSVVVHRNFFRDGIDFNSGIQKPVKKNHEMEAGHLNPTDEILMAMNLLQASLLGFMIFLALMIDRLHHYIRELRLLRKAMEVAKKQNRGFEDGKNGEGKGLGEEVETLRSKVKWLESEYEAKAKEAEAAEAKAEALRKQSEGSLLQYDHLLEDNQSLRNQLESIEQNLSQSDGKKTIFQLFFLVVVCNGEILFKINEGEKDLDLRNVVI
ncbi:hypothetical protein SADUNF_Sadunf14G0117600 [Salix dunnii]|uniref:Endoplasmic reticulum transmembrane protein n=1 Tax=Salix dunnii TaxID=1413687 RepID=A0A835JM14_9ROSI|nr:hypothetical protein SADUNF_Sadunf14G0117600 [Salix dunnii]